MVQRTASSITLQATTSGSDTFIRSTRVRCLEWEKAHKSCDKNDPVYGRCDRKDLEC